jgi:hypothetical protein
MPYRAMKTSRNLRAVRIRGLPAWGWVIASVLLMFQGLTIAVPQCNLSAAAAIEQSSTVGMTAATSMPMMAHSGDHGAGSCDHCLSHTQDHRCAGFHGCNVQLAVVTAPFIAPGLTRLAVILLPAVPPRMSTLAFDAPLRPPA